VTLNVRSR